MQGNLLTGWIVGTIGVAGLYGAIKNKPWASVLVTAVNPHVQTAKAIYSGSPDATYVDFSTAAKVGTGTGAPVSGSVAPVLAYANAQIGKPYLWGGSGPDKFDCSGLTMRAFDTVGIHLPHNAAAQLAMTINRKIAMTTSPPAGALVFYGMPPHHVGISLGNGQMVSAPHTGAFVEVENIQSFGNDLSAMTMPISDTRQA